METKICTKCKDVKDLDMFPYCKTTKDRKRNECKDCECQRNKIRYLQNKEAFNKNHRIWVENNKVKSDQIKRKWRVNNSEKVKIIEKNWRKNNPEKVKNYNTIQRRKERDNCSNYYISKLLVEQGFCKKDITAELMEVKKLIIKTKRLCKTSQI